MLQREFLCLDEYELANLSQSMDAQVNNLRIL